MEKKERVKILQARRSATKGNLSAFQTFLSNCTSKDYIQLNMRLQKINTLFQNFDELHDELDTLDRSESSVNERFTILESFYQAMSKAQHYLSDGRSYESSNDVQFEQKVFAVKTESLRSSESILEPKQNRHAWISREISWFLNLPKEEKNDYETVERFFNELRQRVQSLLYLGVAVPQEFIIVLVQERFLNGHIREKWENSMLLQDEFPTLDQLFNFLYKVILMSKQEHEEKLRREARIMRFKSPERSISRKVTRKCFACYQDYHHLLQCDVFRNFTVRQRLKLITDVRICKICLNKHSLELCLSPKRCKICDRKHHTWIHIS